VKARLSPARDTGDHHGSSTPDPVFYATADTHIPQSVTPSYEGNQVGADCRLPQAALSGPQRKRRYRSCRCSGPIRAFPTRSTVLLFITGSPMRTARHGCKKRNAGRRLRTLVRRRTGVPPISGKWPRDMQLSPRLPDALALGMSHAHLFARWQETP